MILEVKAPVSVQLIYDHRKNRVFPAKILWDGREYKIRSVGLHYTYREGKTLYHAFTASAETLSFKLIINTGNLFCYVEQVSDGRPD